MAENPKVPKKVKRSELGKTDTNQKLKGERRWGSKKEGGY